MEKSNITPAASALEAFQLTRPEASVPAAASPLSPMDLAKYRVSEAGIHSVKLPVKPRIRKPGKAEWFRTAQDESSWPQFYIFTDEEDPCRPCFLCAPNIASILGSIAVPTLLVPCINLSGEIFFWPQKISDHANTWSESARRIAIDARKEWRRCSANMLNKEYDAWAPASTVPEPTWPDSEAVLSLLTDAIDSRVIANELHPVVCRMLLK